MINCLVIDDEPLALRLVADYVKKTEGLELVASFSDAIKALHFLETAQIDLIFLDIQMPNLTGIQFLKIINKKYKVVLTTAYESYALEGYELDVIDYLLKPISFDRFLMAVEKLKSRTTEVTPVPSAPPAYTPNYIFVKSEYKSLKINFDEILYLEGLGDYVAIHLAEEKILTLEKMKRFEEDLPNDRFVRVHRSYIISIEKIKFVERNRVVINEKYLPIGATYQKAFWKQINQK